VSQSARPRYPELLALFQKSHDAVLPDKLIVIQRVKKSSALYVSNSYPVALRFTLKQPGHSVACLVHVLCPKPEGRSFVSRRGRPLDFSIDLILPAAE
jgi:hypothetical protein